MGVPHAAFPEEKGPKLALACHSDWNDGRSNLGNGLLNGWRGFPPEKRIVSIGGEASGDRKRRDRRSVDDMDNGLVGVGIWETRDLREPYHRCFVGGQFELELALMPTAEAGRC